VSVKQKKKHEEKMSTAAECNLVVMGGGGTGKSALSVMFCHHHFVEMYDPTIEDFFRRQVSVDEIPSLVTILDTAGQEEYSAMKSQWVRSGKGFLLCYSITDQRSFEEVNSLKDFILREKDTDQVPMVLVGTKCDLEAHRQVSSMQGADLAKEFGCPFFETSSKMNINVEYAFFEAVRQVRLHDKPAVTPRNKSGSKKLKLKERLCTIC